MQSQVLDRIEVVEPTATCDIHAGTFFFVSKEGQPSSAEFYVRACATDESKYQTDAVARALRVDAYNEQYIEAYDNLMALGCTRIVYTEVVPSEFF